MQRHKEKEERTAVVVVRLTAGERERLQEQARSAGITLSALIRASLNNVQIRTHADAEVLAELRKLGGLCKHLYNSGVDGNATGAALAALQAAAAALVQKG